jgi:hypothetical protein
MLYPLGNLFAIIQRPRMITVPMPLAACVLHIIAKQDDTLCPGLISVLNSLVAAVLSAVKNAMICA